MRGGYSTMAFVLALVGLLAVVSSAQATDYYATTNPGTTAPGSSPWVAVPAPPNNTVTIYSGATVWFATDNGYNSGAEKSYTLQLDGNVGLLTFDWAMGYYNGGASTVYVASSTSQNDGVKMLICVSFDPQPAWEVVQITSSSLVNHVVYVNGGSVCWMKDPIGYLMQYNGYYGPPSTWFAYTEVWACPIDFEIDTAAPVYFIAPPGSGSWTYDFVYEDPWGNPMPQGGVRWMSDGAGLHADDEYEMEFSLMGSAETTYWCYTYDAVGGEHRTFWLDARSAGAIPTVSEWGLIVMTLLLLTAGTIVFARRRRPAVCR